MKPNLAQIEAQLSTGESKRFDELVDIINKNVNPPKAVTREDIYIRAMYIVSNEINSYGGKFPTDEIERLTELVIDAPVMVGHRKDRLPVGRIFFAEVEEKNEQLWLKAYFYWLKKSEDSESLKKNIDGGVFKECSIGFVYQMPECSICGQDIRNCRHNPQENYSVGNQQQSCFYYYRQIEKVLEASLVYRGAVPNTSITNKLNNQIENQEINPISSLDVLDRDKFYLVTPNYEGVDLCFNTKEEVVTLSSQPEKITINEIKKQLGKENHLPSTGYGQLIGYRGKERLSQSLIGQFLRDNKGPITRVELKLFPNFNSLPKSQTEQKTKVGVIPFAVGSYDELAQLIKRLKTKNGVRIWSVSPELYQSKCYVHKSEIKNQVNRYKFEKREADQAIVLTINNNQTVQQYLIQNFDHGKLSENNRFTSCEVTSQVNKKCSEISSGKIERFLKNNKWQMIKLDGDLSGWLTIAPVKLNGKEQSLISFQGNHKVEVNLNQKGWNETVLV